MRANKIFFKIQSRPEKGKTHRCNRKKYSHRSPKIQKKLPLELSRKARVFTKTVTDRSAIEMSIKKAKLEIKDLVDNLLSGKQTFFYKEKICNGTPIDFCRVLLEWSRSSSIDLAIRNIIVSAFYSSEVKQGGSGLISCLIWLDSFEVSESSSKSEPLDVEKVLKSWGLSGLSYQVSKNLFYAGSAGMHVDLEEGEQVGTKITVTEGQPIKGHVDYLFLSKNPSIEFMEKTFLVAIDGIIENISQIHHLLDGNEKNRIILMARGFLPDVANTLAENYCQKRLLVVPFVVKSWEVENFLDLEKKEFSCACSSIGSDIRKLKLKNQILCTLSKDSLLYGSSDSSRRRQGKVSFGKDLGALAGISKDRVKTLITLTRFSARSGVSRCSTSFGSFYVPNSSIEAAKKTHKSMMNILQNLGGIIISL